MSGPAVRPATVTAVASEAPRPVPPRQAHQSLAILARAARLRRVQIGAAIVGLITLVALAGPLVAPHSPTEFVGAPNGGPSAGAVLGTDALGRDVLSRFLSGGRTVLWLSAAATLVGITAGTAIGLVAAYARGWLDEVLMRSNDVLLAFPQIIFVLLAIAAVGPKLWLIVLTVGATHAPRVARVMRGAAQQVVERDFVDAAEAVGERALADRRRRAAPQRDQHAAGGDRPADDLLDRSRRRGQLPGVRAPAADGRLGADDQREPTLDHGPAVGGHAAGDRDRAADGGREPDHGRDRPRGDPPRPGGRRVSAALAGAAPVVSICDLRIELTVTGDDVVDEIALEVRPGEILGLVGESGSGKTTVGLSLLGHVRPGGQVAGGAIDVAGLALRKLDGDGLRRLRGGVVAYIPQDPGTALNPALRIRSQLEEVLEARIPRRDVGTRARRLREVLEEVALPSDDEFLRRYPHQLSGGQQQRVSIAMAFIDRPRVIVCDEPTTGLDVTTQARVLRTVRELCRSHGVAALYVTHDLAVVAELADRVAVLYGGRIVESGPRDELFTAPRHPYTRRLLRAVPDVAGRRTIVGIPGYAALPGSRPPGCSFHPRCDLATAECRSAFPPVTDVAAAHQVRCHHAGEAARRPVEPAGRRSRQRAGEGVLLAVRELDAHYGSRQALFGLDFEVHRNECAAVVGESGSGKTTLARCVAGLHRHWSGELRFGGDSLVAVARRRTQPQRQRIQYVFQNPYASLNPRRTVGQTIARQLQLFFPGPRRSIAQRVAECLESVALSARAAHRFPDELSGGERQRVAIARALAAEPRLLVCDEVTSALDVSVQAAIVELLGELRSRMGLSLLFVTHELALIRTIADRVVVMNAGRIVEIGPVEQILAAPRAQYTRELLANTPSIESALAQAGAGG
jgi:peptide/nickel transport system ATP-binding protein